MADAPYAFERGGLTAWGFALAYAPLAGLMPLAHQYLAASRLPHAERDEALQVSRAYPSIAAATVTALAKACVKAWDWEQQGNWNLSSAQWREGAAWPLTSGCTAVSGCSPLCGCGCTCTGVPR